MTHEKLPLPTLCAVEINAIYLTFHMSEGTFVSLIFKIILAQLDHLNILIVDEDIL